MIDDGHSIAHAFSHLKDVRTEEDGASICNMIEQPLSAFSLVDWIKIGEWLVQKQQFGLVDEG